MNRKITTTPQEIYINTYLPVHDLQILTKKELNTLCEINNIDHHCSRTEIIEKLERLTNDNKTLRSMLFHITVLHSNTWNIISTNLSSINLEHKRILYIIFTMSKANQRILCLVQYYGDIITCYDIQQITKIELKIREWKDIDIFSHLPFFQIMLHSIVTYSYDKKMERGIFHSETTTYYSYLNRFITEKNIDHMFSDDNSSVLVIEETKAKQYIQYDECRKVKYFGILKFSMKQLVETVHFIYPAKKQCYHCFDLHKNPHYAIREKYIPFVIWVLHNLGTTYMIYSAEQPFHHNEFITIYNNKLPCNYPASDIYNLVQSYKLKSRNIANFFLSYGFSGECITYKGGPPELTKAIGKHKDEGILLVKSIFPILISLSNNLKRNYDHVALDQQRNRQFSQNLGCNLDVPIGRFNIYEGFDISLQHSDTTLLPHCDVMNDGTSGYNYISVIKQTNHSTDKTKCGTISIICYTRKAIGDFLART